MRRLVEANLSVSYGQAYVHCREGPYIQDMADHFAGQRNGLCGAAYPGRLFLRTGLHTGVVGFAVELYDDPPPVDDSWQEIVEASFTPSPGYLLLTEWSGHNVWPLDLERRDYRVRYCGRGLDEAQHADPTSEDPVDFYLLQFWPGASEPDAVLKQTSEYAAYSHAYARELLPAPAPDQRAEAS